MRITSKKRVVKVYKKFGLHHFRIIEQELTDGICYSIEYCYWMNYRNGRVGKKRQWSRLLYPHDWETLSGAKSALLDFLERRR